MSLSAFQQGVSYCLLPLVFDCLKVQTGESIRESVDSLCRDGSGPPIVCVLANARDLSLSGLLAILFERFSTQ